MAMGDGHQFKGLDGEGSQRACILVDEYQGNDRAARGKFQHSMAFDLHFRRARPFHLEVLVDPSVSIKSAIKPYCQMRVPSFKRIAP